eukprot:TRINITY_DN2132_c0_g2_i3.p1 TRINITY_DN2132_c0_g2~~TRINITY_DN2132_c0_g2_i3.p1  ORF type:complete len:557 (-),score=77.53 TRINITY_DN2132_c0_g2_i3:74-1543(-)
MLGSTSVSCDVCVIGGGLAGVTAAYNLRREGKDVVLIEGRSIASGETGRTSALLMGATDDGIRHLVHMFGEKGASLAVTSHRAAIDIIEENVKREKIECDFERLPAYIMPEKNDGSHVKELEKELEAARTVGWSDVSFVPQAPISGFESGSSLKFADHGMFHPLKYLVALLKAYVAAGGRVYTRSEVNEAKEGEVKTVAGGVVKCKDIVAATCAPMFGGMRTLLRAEPYRSYCVMAKVPRGSVERALFWDTADPYHYARLVPIAGDSVSEYLLLGGGDHAVGHMPKDADQPFHEIEAWGRQRWPAMGNIEIKWSGEVWEPIDSLGLIGRNPLDAEHSFIISGDSGTGMTHTTLGAKLVTDLIMGRSNEWEDIYSPSRVPSLRSAGRFMRYGMHTASAFAGRVMPGDVTDIEDIKVGCGAIMNKDGKRMAVYKDEDGTVTKCSAVCPHMGGALYWNATERSWDCAAHGSRFDKKGALLNGPATSALEPIN